jgi:hypothetical protein
MNGPLPKVKLTAAERNNQPTAAAAESILSLKQYRDHLGLRGN